MHNSNGIPEGGRHIYFSFLIITQFTFFRANLLIARPLFAYRRESMAITSLTVGDRVMVAYPATDTFNNPAKVLDGQEFTVKTVHMIKKRGQSTGRKYYELYGAESKFGINYVFLDDELIKI